MDRLAGIESTFQRQVRDAGDLYDHRMRFDGWEDAERRPCCTIRTVARSPRWTRACTRVASRPPNRRITRQGKHDLKDGRKGGDHDCATNTP